MGDKEKPSTSSKTKELTGLGNIYLVAYNVLQFIGWTYLFCQSFSHFISGRTRDTLWDEVQLTLVLFQTGAFLEVVHVAVGLVKSNLAITFVQVLSRVGMCGVLLKAPPAHLSIGFSCLLIAWSITEIIRYLFYALSLLNSVPYFLIWCRYTFFYVLYPLGVTGELICHYYGQTFFGKNKIGSVEMPNTINFTFSLQYLILIVMLSYMPIFPKLYFHMISQRRKVIGGSSEKKIR